MPYREGNEVSALGHVLFPNQHFLQVKYAPQPYANSNISQPSNHYDSDAEPLIAPYRSSNSLDDDSFLRFTATGRPVPAFKHSSLQGLGAENMYCLPQLLPRRYTDESIIPAIIVDVIPKTVPSSPTPKKGSLNTFIRRRVRGDAKDKESGLTKVVYMPRGEYLKYFARGLKGEYTGSEPHRRWTEEELEEQFGKFKPVYPKKSGYRVPS